jgi:hypothetical protein
MMTDIGNVILNGTAKFESIKYTTKPEINGPGNVNRVSYVEENFKS